MVVVVQKRAQTCSSEARYGSVVKWLRRGAEGGGHSRLVLTRRTGISMYFTRGGAFQIAPGPRLPEGEPFSDIRQEVVDDAAIVRWREALLDC